MTEYNRKILLTIPHHKYEQRISITFPDESTYRDTPFKDIFKSIRNKHGISLVSTQKDEIDGMYVDWRGSDDRIFIHYTIGAHDAELRYEFTYNSKFYSYFILLLYKILPMKDVREEDIGEISFPTRTYVRDTSTDTMPFVDAVQWAHHRIEQLLRDMPDNWGVIWTEKDATNPEVLRLRKKYNIIANDPI